MMQFWGVLLLTLTGWGVGCTAAQRQKDGWRQLHTFVRLLQRLHTDIAYHALPTEELLCEAAKDPSFASMDLASCRSLEELPVPKTLGEPFCSEAHSELAQLCAAPKQEVCCGLQRLIELCSGTADECLARANSAGKLYPRLGACCGAVAALLLL